MKKMTKLIRWFLVPALLVCIGWRGDAQQGRALDKLMLDKLDNSKKLLEGIVLADFTKVSRSAEKLIQLSKTAEWMVLRTPRYEMANNEFRRAAEGLIQKSQAKNLDGVTLAYFDLTMACVRCHQHVREVRDARLIPPHRPDHTTFAE